jgi:hypothetical protein
MDVNLKGLEPQLVARLSEQAAIEGMSAQEWMRQALRRTAALLTPTELLTQAEGRTAVTDAEFRSIMSSVAKRDPSSRARKRSR